MSAWLKALIMAALPAETVARRLGLALLIMVPALYLGGHSLYGLFDVDEAIFTEATLEMREQTAAHGALGLAMPTYNGEPRYHKPPLVYWAQGLAMEIWGEDSLFAARAPSAISALLTILILGGWVFALTRNRAWAMASMLMMALNISFLVVGRAATADGLLNVSSMALVAWTSYILLKPAPAFLVGKEWVVTGALAALGMLAKGPIAWFPAAFVCLTLLLGAKDKKKIWHMLAPWKAFGVMLVALAPWFAMLVQQHGLGFFYEFIMVHNIGRYASGLSNTQSSSHWYYLVVMLFGFFPWVFMLPEACVALLKPLVKTPTRKGAKKVDYLKPVKTLLAKPKAEAVLPFLCFVWAVLYILFFSFSKTKLAHYIVPAYPALSVLVAWYWTVFLPERKETRRGEQPEAPRRAFSVVTTLLGVFMALLIALLMGLLDPLLMGLREPVLHGWLGWLQLVFNFPWPPKDALAVAALAQPVVLDPAPFIMCLLILLGLIPAGILLAGCTPKEGDGALGLSFAAVWAVCLGLIVCGLVPTIWAYTQAPLARFAALTVSAPAQIPMVHLGMHKPSVLYLSGRRFTKLENPLQLPEVVQPPETWVLTPITKVAGIQAELEARREGQILAQRCDGGYCMLTVAK
jgi:4-amino-4-deoxy-L-arabinose transferase-like glycosyltransferase